MNLERAEGSALHFQIWRDHVLDINTEIRKPDTKVDEQIHLLTLKAAKPYSVTSIVEALISSSAEIMPARVRWGGGGYHGIRGA
jgi:hypothetical protein